MQAGREIRVMVKPDEVDDTTSYKMARDIKTKIESEMQYPGTIKVTVIRETRAQEEAKFLYLCRKQMEKALKIGLLIFLTDFLSFHITF